MSNIRSERRPRRTKQQLDSIIHAAAEIEIDRHGFVLSSLTRILGIAGIEPAVFYKRFPNLEQLFIEIGSENEYWFRDIDDAYKSNENEFSMLEHLFQYLMTHSIPREIVRWELSDRNPTTVKTYLLRDAFFASAIHNLRLQGCCNEKQGVLLSIIIGGILYISLLNDYPQFCGLNLKDAATKELIQSVFNETLPNMFQKFE